MLTLCGFAASNYHNKVKLALLEKGVPFVEELAWVGATDAQASPLGKVPYLKTPEGAVCESAVMLEYIEQKYPQNPLLPADAFAASKVRELALFLDLHLELVARELYAQAFFGGSVSDATKESVHKLLVRNIEAFKRIAHFAPYVAGDSFTVADCVAFSNLPLIGMATRAVYGEDLLLTAGVDYKPYIKLVGERPSAQKVIEDRKAEMTRAKT